MSARARSWSLVTALTVTALALGACVPAQGADDYEVSASFARVPGLVEQGTVRTMGLDVGEVTSIAIDGDTVRVTMRIDGDVPLPDHVEATVAPMTLLDERHVLLRPSFRPGDDRLAPGTHLPLERTAVSAEPDDVLVTATELLTEIERTDTASLVRDAARLLDGRGAGFGDALERAAAIATTVRAQDETLLDLAGSLSQLTGALDDRERQITDLVDVARRGVATLTADVERVPPLLRRLVALTEQAELVVETYEDTLPGDLAILTQLVLQLEANTGSVVTLIRALPAVADTLFAAHRPEVQGLKLRLSLGPTMDTVYEMLALLLGLPPLGCAPTPDRRCVP